LAEVALLQAIALFPGSPEGASRLIELYVRQERFDEAAIIGLSWLNNDPDNRTAGELMRHVSILAQMAANRVPLTLKFRSDPGDATVYLELAATLAQMQRYEELDEVVRQYLGNKEPDSKALERTVNLFNNFQQNERLIRLLQTELKRRPASYHLWYNLGVSQALHRDTTNALTSLERAVRLNPNLKQYAAQDPRLENLHGMPEFHGLTRDGARSNSQPPAPRP
jgi:tetratricopeptide (TPR) repeat protein